MVKLRKIIRMCLSRILRMEPTNGNHHQKRNPAKGTGNDPSMGGSARLPLISLGGAQTSSTGDQKQSSTGDQNAGLSSSAAAGGVAKASNRAQKICDKGVDCPGFHCRKAHPKDRKKPEKCNFGKKCFLCNPELKRRNCSNYQGCPVPDCELNHDPKRQLPTVPQVSSQAPPVQGDDDSSQVPPIQCDSQSVENFPSLGVSVVQMNPTGVWATKPAVSLNLSEFIDGILNCLDENVFGSLKPVLQKQLVRCETLDDLLLMGDLVNNFLGKICSLLQDDNPGGLDSLESQFINLLPVVMTELGCEGHMPSFPEEIDDVFDKIRYFASAFDALTLFLETQRTPLPKAQSLPVPVHPATKLGSSSVSMVERFRVAASTISEMMKQLPFDKQADFNKCLLMLALDDITSASPELVETMVSFAKNAYSKIMNQIRIEEEAKKQALRASLFDPESFKVETSITESRLLAMAYMFAISFMVGSNMKTFSDIVDKSPESAALIHKDLKGFFDHLVRAIYRKLIRSDSEVTAFQEAVLNPSGSEVPETITDVFATATSWFCLSQKSSEGSVIEALKIFSSWNDRSQLLTPAFLKFLYSYVGTRGQTQMVQFSKLVDNYFVVIMKYFGIHMVASEKGFGYDFILSYKNEGNTHEINVSALVCHYVFQLLCMSKVFMDTGKQSCVRFGNCGIDGSISHLFDSVGQDLIDGFGGYQPFKAPTKMSKPHPEFIPNVFNPSLISRVSNIHKSEHTDPSVDNRVKVLMHFLKESIDKHIRSCYEKKTEQKYFQLKMKEVESMFLPPCVDTESMERFLLVISTCKSDPMKKLLKMGTELLTDDSLKKDICRGFNFLEPQNVGEFERFLLKTILDYSSNINDNAKLDECVGNAVRDFSEILQFIASSGVTLAEVLHACDMFKELYNYNKSLRNTKMVFFNFFITAFMVAASKKWNLTFQTMYTSLVTCLSETTYIKPTEEFKTIKGGVDMLRLTGFTFERCLRKKHCELFCKEAFIRGSVENPTNLENFRRLVQIGVPIIMISDLMFKQDPTSLPDGMSISISDCLDRVTMLLLTTTNRDELFSLFGFMKPTVIEVSEIPVWYSFKDSPKSRLNMHVDKRHFEEEVVISMSNSIKGHAISRYFQSWTKYLEENRSDIDKVLNKEDLKTLRIDFRKNAKLDTFFEILIHSGLISHSLVEKLKQDPNLYRTTKRGNVVLDIVLIANAIVSDNNGFSPEFYEDLMRIVHSALYPNIKDMDTVRKMVREMVNIQKSQRMREQGQAPVKEETDTAAFSMCIAMFGDHDEPEPEPENEPTVEELKGEFVKMLPENTSELVNSRLGANPIVFTCKNVRGFFTNRPYSGAQDDPLPPPLSKYFTTELRELISAFDDSFSDVMNYFLNIQTYVETFFPDEEEKGIDFAEFRAAVLDETTELSKAFNRYVEASINEATESIKSYGGNLMNQVD